MKLVFTQDTNVPIHLYNIVLFQTRIGSDATKAPVAVVQKFPKSSSYIMHIFYQLTRSKHNAHTYTHFYTSHHSVFVFGLLIPVWWTVYRCLVLAMDWRQAHAIRIEYIVPFPESVWDNRSQSTPMLSAIGGSTLNLGICVYAHRQSASAIGRNCECVCN